MTAEIKKKKKYPSWINDMIFFSQLVVIFPLQRWAEWLSI